MLQKRVAVVWLIVCFTFLVSGCTLDPSQMKPVDPEGGIWDRYFVYPLYVSLDWFAGHLMNNYGLSILVVTIILRLLILPLTIKQIQSSKAMQALQPQMQKLREKYKDNQQKLQEETMKLFQKHNVNPMSGCLPILVQMPILIAFYQAIMRNDHIRDASFLWLQLGKPDSFFVLPFLAAVGTYFQSKMMGATNNPQAKMLMTIMPAMIFFIALSLPSALSLYWVYGTLFTIVQTYFLRDMYKPKEGETGK